MNTIRLSGVFVIAACGSLAVASPLRANPVNYESIPADVINGILHIEPDFFDRGREKFEEEIERLTRSQLDSETPTLTIDESVQFDPERFENLQPEFEPSAKPRQLSFPNGGDEVMG